MQQVSSLILALWAPECKGSVTAVGGLSRPAAGRILVSPIRDQTLVHSHCKADSQPLDHQGSPEYYVF